MRKGKFVKGEKAVVQGKPRIFRFRLKIRPRYDKNIQNRWLLGGSFLFILKRHWGGGVNSLLTGEWIITILTLYYRVL